MRLIRPLVLFLLLAAAGSAWSCAVEVANGGLHFDLLPGPILGRGTSGIVQRVTEESGHHFEKGYFSKSKFDRETMETTVIQNGRSNRDSDLRYFAIFRFFEKAGIKVGPRIPEVEPAEVQINGETLPGIRLRGDFDGRDVFSLLSDESLDKDLRARIRANYEVTIKTLQTFLETECEGALRVESMATRAQIDSAVYPKYRLPFLEISISTLKRTEPGLPALSSSLHIAADGFIVDARTLEIWLADPN